MLLENDPRTNLCLASAFFFRFFALFLAPALCLFVCLIVRVCLNVELKWSRRIFVKWSQFYSFFSAYMRLCLCCWQYIITFIAWSLIVYSQYSVVVFCCIGFDYIFCYYIILAAPYAIRFFSSIYVDHKFIERSLMCFWAQFKVKHPYTL